MAVGSEVGQETTLREQVARGIQEKCGDFHWPDGDSLYAAAEREHWLRLAGRALEVIDNAGQLADADVSKQRGLELIRVRQRLAALAEWMQQTHCGLSGQQIIALAEDSRDADIIAAAMRRTGHRIGCDCPSCTQEAP